MLKNPTSDVPALESYIGMTLKQQHMDIEEETKPALQLTNLPTVTFESIKNSINEK
jgi:hypothetical protein